MDISSIDYVNFQTIIKRGTAEIIEESDDLLFMRDTVSDIYMLACDDGEAAKAVMDRHRDTGFDIITTTNREAAYYTLEQYGFDGVEECYQFAYTGDVPEPDPRLDLRVADLGDLSTLMESYDGIDEDEMTLDINRGLVLMGYHGDELVGFIGEHLEGSQGMLFVYPEHRRKGYASALENAVFARTIEKGLIPFGQVIAGNDASYSLQMKKGLTLGSRMVYWAWIDE